MALTRPRPDARHLLVRILDEPALVAEVRALPPAALAKLIDHVGLEDAGEIVALATTEQIERVFDEDLWTRARAGDDESFDAERFIVWLEILLEAGEAVAARRLAELSPDTVTLAVHRLASVVDFEELTLEIADGIHEDGDAINRALENALSHEIGTFMIVARQHAGWDALVQAIVALDERDHDACRRLLERCAALTGRQADDAGGLHEVLAAEDTLADDVAGDRAERRAKDGFLAASDARAFLRLARETEPTKAPDAVSRAYFRELDRSPRPSPAPPSKLERMIASAGLAAPKKRLSRAKRSSLLDGLDPAAQAARMEELAFLVNVLLAGDRVRWRPADAAEAVLAVIEHGAALVDADITKNSVLPAFRAGVRAGKLDAIARDRRQ